jgi:cytochrome P450
MIDERRAEKKEGSDLMNILLETEFYQKNDDGLLIDEIITFFLAGMKTSQTTTTNLIY